MNTHQSFNMTSKKGIGDYFEKAGPRPSSSAVKRSTSGDEGEKKKKKSEYDKKRNIIKKDCKRWDIKWLQKYDFTKDHVKIRRVLADLR